MAQDISVIDDTLSLHNGGHDFNVLETLLLNDTAPDDSVQVVILSSPAHGQIIGVDGLTFTYLADPGYVGDDSFSYKIQTVPLQRLTFDTANSSLDFHATVQVPLGTDDDTETIPVTGELVVDLGTDPAQVDSIRIVSLDVRNAGSTGLRFDYTNIGITIATLRINADAEKIRLASVEMGARTATAGLLNSFTQTDNLIGVAVEADLDGSGLLSGQVPSDTQILATETRVDLGGSAIMQGSNMAVLLNINTSHQFDLDGNDVTLDISGSLQAPGVFQERIESGVANVVIHVGEVTGVDDESSLPRFARVSLYPNPVSRSLKVEIEPGIQSMGRETRLAIVDVLGREVLRRRVQSTMTGSFTEIFDVSQLSPGVYFVTAVSGDSVISRPFVRF